MISFDERPSASFTMIATDVWRNEGGGGGGVLTKKRSGPRT